MNRNSILIYVFFIPMLIGITYVVTQKIILLLAFEIYLILLIKKYPCEKEKLNFLASTFFSHLCFFGVAFKFLLIGDYQFNIQVISVLLIALFLSSIMPLLNILFGIIYESFNESKK